MTKPNKINLFKFILGVIIIIIISLIPHPEGIDQNAMQYIAILVGMIYFLIINICPEYVSVMFALAFCVLFQVGDFTHIFSAFSNTTVWLLIGILPLSVLISKSGLMKRLALNVMKMFPNTYSGQLLAIIVASIIISPLIPSITAKASILAPFAINVAEEMKFEKKSKPMTGLFMGAYLMGAISGHIFYSGSINVFIMLGLLPVKMQHSFTWWNWLECTVVWGICIYVLGYIAIKALYKPKEQIELPKKYIEHKLRDLGPISKNEIKVAIVLVITLIGWITKSVHGIPEAAIALFAYCVLIFLKTGNKSDFRGEVAWDMIIFIGGLMCMASIMTALKIDLWISDILTPIIRPMLVNVYVYVISLSVLVAIGRYFIVSPISSVSLFYVIFSGPGQTIGVSPWVTLFIVTTISQLWSTAFNNTTYLTAVATIGEDKIDFREAVKMSYVYVIISIIGFVFSIYTWRSLGMII